MKISLYPRDIEPVKELLKLYLKASFQDEMNRRLHLLARRHVRSLGKKITDLEWEDAPGEISLNDEEIVALALAAGFYTASQDVPEYYGDTLRRLAFDLDPKLLNA
jgi:hypothetical protein